VAKLKSICALANKNVWGDLVIMLRSFDIFNQARIYIACDVEIERKLSGFKLSQCDIVPIRIVTPKLSEIQSHGAGFLDLLMLKMDIMERAVLERGETMLFDTDMVFLNELVSIDLKNNEIVLNRSGLKDPTYGIYSAGYCGASTPKFPIWWRNATLTVGKYYEQDCLDQAPRSFRCQELGMEHNFFGGRLDHAPTKEEVDRRYGAFKVDDTVRFDGKPLVSVHISVVSKMGPLPLGKPVGGFHGMVIDFLEQSPDPRHKKVLSMISPNHVVK